MSQIINELATIEVSDEALQQLDVGGIYQSFSNNYRKLDDLKNFRTEYEKKNFLARWWHKDKLQAAQLDSAEVQAEFSKTIGQLMMISIMQSKKLSEQQMQLNDQQGKLKTQADGIAAHASKLQEQHQVLAEQSQKLEALVREYFELKGLTEEGAQKLIEIAREVKATKDQMLQEFASRAKGVEAVCAEVQVRMESVSARIDGRIRLSEEQAKARIEDVQRDMCKKLDFYETSQHAHQQAVQNDLNRGIEQLAQGQRALAAELYSKQAAYESQVSDLLNKQNQQLAAHQEKLSSIDASVKSLSNQSNDLDAAIAGTKDDLSQIVERQQNHQNSLATFRQEVLRDLKRLRYFALVMVIVIIWILGSIMHMMKWI